MSKQNHIRADHTGEHRTAFEKNKRRIFASQDVCALCGKPVDFSLKYPDPMCATIDHIIPINKGGSPSDISNLQLAHFCCNRAKSDRLQRSAITFKATKEEVISNRILPQSCNWHEWIG